MANNSRYKIPRKRKATIILYTDVAFQTEDDFLEYLTVIKKFSPLMASLVLSNIPYVEKEEMEKNLKAAKISAERQQKLFSGELSKSKKKSS